MKRTLLIFLTVFISSMSLFAQSSVTFKVDMTGVIVDANGVHVAGSFQSPTVWQPGATRMTREGTTNIYSVTVPSVANGAIEYKFINGNSWGTDESVPVACAVNNNRGATISSNVTLPTALFGQCPAFTTTYSVTFKVDMTGQTVSSAGVHVAGSFQSPTIWQPGATLMTKEGSTNIYSVTVSGIAGNIQYKFVNGDAWGTDESVPAACASSNNRASTISATTILPAVGFGTCMVIPLELLSFNARSDSKTASLTWTTAQERDFSHFEIERSTSSAKGFEKVGTVKGSNRATQANYTFADPLSTNAVSYYRLKMVDLNGSFKYSNVAAVSSNNAKNVLFSPNPAQKELNIDYPIVKSTATVKIAAIDGRILATKTLSEGSTRTSLDVSALQSGFYFLIMENGAEKSVFKFSKL